MRIFFVASFSLAVLLLGACGDDGAPAADAGPTPDSGGDADSATPGTDSSLPSDAGTGTDSASPADSSTPADAGPRTFLPVYPLAAQFTEGGIYDSVNHRFYVGSLADGSVNQIDAETGSETVLFTETAAGVWWTLGMDVDETNELLYVCAMDDRSDAGADPPYDGYVWVFDTQTGARVANHDLGDVREDATCTDVVVADDGTAYICDRENPRIYALSPAGELSVLADDPLLDGAVVGQNGLLVLPDQTALLSLVYLPSRLVYVRISDGSLYEVAIDGDFSDGLPPLSGADGMAWDGSSVLVMFTSQLNRIEPILADWSAASSTTIDVPSGMTDVVESPGGSYLLNGQSLGFALGSDPDRFALVRFDGTL